MDIIKKKTPLEEKIEESGFDLQKSIDELTKQMQSANSLKRNFLRGIFLGIGTAIGASVIAAVVISVLYKIWHSLNIPTLK